MKVPLLLVVCALAAAEEPEGLPSRAQVTVALGYLYRRFLHVAAPKQLALQDALGMHYREGMMATEPIRSTAQATFDNKEHPTFSQITSLLNPGQKRISDDAPWLRQDASDMIIAHHYGGAMKVHMVTTGGIHKEAIVGDPLKSKNAKLIVVVPKRTYVLLESLSDEKANFHSYISVPAYEQNAASHFNNKDMEAKFPNLAEMFHELEKPGVHHDERDDHDDDDDDDDDDRDGHRRGRGRHGSFRRRRH